MKCLLVVESPAKARTIGGYLRGRSETWTVLATCGHITDLPSDELGIREDDGTFVGDWRLDADKRGIVEQIRATAAQADRVFIGSDDDREGEKISADVVQYAGIRDARRIAFTEITPEAITRAIAEGMRDIDATRVDAQVARRLVDREIGYPVSQLIHRDFRRAGRAQLPRGVGRVISPALHLLVEAERRIQGHMPQEYHQIVADYLEDGVQFRLVSREKFRSDEAAQRDELLHEILTHRHLVFDYKRQTRDVTPYPPLTTARLQRCAFYLFGFSPDYTMKLAQKLYEGVDIATGRHGLITYPRTDSYRLADPACAKMITLLSSELDEELVLTSRRVFEDREGAQAAHEAIRPTGFDQEYWPKHVREYLYERDGDLFLLYELIWYRTLATQMKDAIYDASELIVDVNGHQLRAQANYRIFEGWEALDGERANASERGEEESYRHREVILPAVVIGNALNCIEVKIIENSTRRPPRYGVGRFLTTLDSKGIARPSTLDTIVRNLTDKGYVAIHQGMLYATELGCAVDDWVTEKAAWLNDTDHARRFEERLDAVERSEEGRNAVIADYVMRVEDLREALGYEEMDESHPSEQQLCYAQRLAADACLEVPADAMTNRRALGVFIRKHRPRRACAGRCPSCKTGRVVVHAKLFACDQRSCTFKLWRSGVERFVRNFIDADTSPDDLVKELLRRKKTLMEGLRSSSTGKPFDAYVGLAHAEGGDHWQIELMGYPRRSARANFSGWG